MKIKHYYSIWLTISLCLSSLAHASDEFVNAAGENDLTKVRRLMRTDIDMNALSSRGDTALDLAAKNNHMRMASYLLQQGMNINVRDSQGNTPLMEACYSGHYKMAKFLIDQGADVQNRDQTGGTALMDAAGRGHVEIVKLLLKHKADVNADRTYGGGRALTEAFRRKNMDIVKLLLEAGADPTVELKRLKSLNQRSNNSTIALLERYMPKKEDTAAVNALVEAARTGNLATLKEAMKKVNNVDTLSEKGGSAMNAAAMRGHLHIVKYLLENGSNINAETRNGGYTAIMDASYTGQYNTVKYLIEQGADVNKANHPGTTALMLASSRGFLPIVKLLLQHKANVNATLHGTQRNALYGAFQTKKHDVVKILLEAGAKPSQAMLDQVKISLDEAEYMYNLLRKNM